MSYWRIIFKLAQIAYVSARSGNGHERICQQFDKPCKDPTRGRTASTIQVTV